MPLPYTDESLITAKLDTLQSTINTINNSVTTIKNDLATVKSDVSTIKSDISTIKSDLSTVKSDVATIKTESQTTNTRLNTVNTNLNNMETDIELINTNLNNIESDIETGIDSIISEMIDIKHELTDSTSIINYALEVCKDTLLEMLIRSSSATPTSTALLNEFMAGEDLDRNGLIYGIDFMIDYTDPDMPKMLQTVHSNPSWVDVDTRLTWVEYLETLPYN